MWDFWVIGESMFNFLRNYQAEAIPFYPATDNVWEFQVLNNLIIHLVLSVFLVLTILVGVNLIIALFYIVLMTTDFGHLFTVLIHHPNICFGALSFQGFNGSIVKPT